MPLNLHSEPYARTGNIGDAGLSALLGTPGIDLAQTVVREALQNSCDAAKLGKGPQVQIRLRSLTESERAAIAHQVFVDLPDSSASRERIEAFRGAPVQRVLEIADFGTSGLGGPTRADRVPPGEVPVDFINFMRNVGSARDTHQGGGTYGFGKVSLYLASGLHTILVDTLAVEGGRRFMGCHLGRAFDTPEPGGGVRRYTGRHWWGRRCEEDHFVDPLDDHAAAELSAALGMPARGLDRTGTTIMILDPVFADEDLTTTAGELAEGVLFNFWPRMMADVPENRRLRCSIECEGRSIPIPEPEDFPPLNLFCRAMREVRTSSRWSETVQCRNPLKTLGRMAVAKGLKGPRQRWRAEGQSLFPRTSSHIAVMRPVELVVRYIEGDALPDEMTEWAGVFLADSDDEVERAFAAAEPPAHDDWLPQGMPRGRAKTFVNVALREIKTKARTVAAPSTHATSGDPAGIPLAKLAGRLGAMLDGAHGEGGSRRAGGGGGGRAGRARRASVSRPEFLRLEETTEGMQAVFSCEVRGVHGTGEWRLTATPSVALDGSAAPDFADVAAFQPSVSAIATANGEALSETGEANIGDADGVYQIAVSIPPDCAVVLAATLELESER